MLSAVAFHYFHELLNSHCMLLGDILTEMLQHEHQDVILQTSRTISIIGDAIQKLGRYLFIDRLQFIEHCDIITYLVKLLTCNENVYKHRSYSLKAIFQTTVGKK